MTKPTQEQIQALKPGDRVLVEATVRDGDVIDHDGDVILKVPLSADPEYNFFSAPSAIHSILPREITVGDMVTYPGWGKEGKVLSCHGPWAWVVVEGINCPYCIPLSELRVAS